MRSLEGGGWKSASNGNSLAAYPTSSTVLRGEENGNIRPSTRLLNQLVKNSEKLAVVEFELSQLKPKIDKIDDLEQKLSR